MLVLTKTHDWLAVVCVALYLIGSCGGSFMAPWPRHNLITTGGEVAAGSASDVLSAGPAAEEIETGRSSVGNPDTVKTAFVLKCTNKFTKLIEKSTFSGSHGAFQPPLSFQPPLDDMSSVRHEYRTFLRAWGEARERVIHEMEVCE